MTAFLAYPFLFAIPHLAIILSGPDKVANKTYGFIVV